jgi:hypothetical protein
VRRPVSLALALLALPAAAAGSIFINGVKVDGLANQTFERVNVKFDDKGNILIDAPGYAVKLVEAGKEGQPLPSKRYWLFVEQPAAGTGYELEVLVNGRLVRTVKNAEAVVLFELTKSLRLGKNTVLLSAKKVGKVGPSDAVLKLLIGEGTEGANNVALGATQVKFEANASQTQELSQDFVLNAN